MEPKYAAKDELEVKHCGKESKVSIGEALEHNVGGNAAPEKGGHEKHDSKRAVDGQPCMQKESMQVLASE
jgi:hypothetical protein